MLGFVEITEKNQIGHFRMGKKIIAHHIQGRFQSPGHGLSAHVAFNFVELALDCIADIGQHGLV